MTAKKKCSIMMIAGEASGDLLGGSVLHALRTQNPETHFEVIGVGGQSMIEAALTPLFPLSDLSVMGIAEVIPHLPKLLGRLKMVKQVIAERKPDILLTIDAPDFGLRLQKWTAKHVPQVKRIHMVAPTVWAWRAGRAKKIAQYLDHLLCLFPMEPKYFVHHGLASDFIGHPLVTMIPTAPSMSRADIAAHLNIAPETPYLLLLPGSRMREIETLWPMFLSVYERLVPTYPDLHAVAITSKDKAQLLGHLADGTMRASRAGGGRDRLRIVTSLRLKYPVMQHASAAVHASGTVALELGLCATPMVTAYKLPKLSKIIADIMIKTPYANLVNILDYHMNRDAHTDAIVSEILNDACTVENILQSVQPLLDQQSPERAHMLRGLTSLRGLLSPSDASQTPSEQAASVMMSLS